MRRLIFFPLLRRHSPPLTRSSLPLTCTKPIQQPIHHNTASYSSSSPPTSTSTFNPQTYLASARQKLASQPPTLTFDTLSPTHSRLLTLSLADHAPALFPREERRRSGSIGSTGSTALPQGHHLVYFPLTLPPSRLMPDGTDPAHWPGEPFVRRMWAGGEVLFKEGWEGALRLDGREAACVETVGEPVVKGPEGGEKVFVEVKRAYGLRADGREAVVKEVRRLVFMRERERERERGGGGVGGVGEESGRVVRAPAAPEFTFSLRPDATLLFHFSALTYNAHSIHIDSDYARNREGYKGLLVHGPLTLVLMIQALRACLAQMTWHGQPDTATEGRPMPYVKSLSYRNLAPLYVDEEMKVCLRQSKSGLADHYKWDVWIEGPEGGLAVKGSAMIAW